ncbi:MAG TPA: hypothetical protein VF765_05820 [Polyangiaceae bacterium]
MHDGEHSYPLHLATRVRGSWPSDARPLPRCLEALLDVAYHASFLRNEERPVACRILVTPRSGLPLEDGPPTGLLPMVFTTPRRLDEDELRRIAPAANFYRALVGVEESSSGELSAWGLLQSGPRWMQPSRGGRAREPMMPRSLVVRIVRPGHLVVGCGNQEIAELRGGRLSDFSLDVFRSKWLPGLFAAERETMAVEHRASASPSLEPAVAMALTGVLAQQMIKRVIATIRTAHHGGTVLAVPADSPGESYLHPRFAFDDAPPRRRFRSLVLAMLERLARRSAETGRPASPDSYLHEDDGLVAQLDEALFETASLIASLAQVDGAVVLTKRFEILGFGAEIAGGLPAVTHVRRGLDLEADSFSSEIVDDVGTRHRSAYRLSEALPGALAIVVSQDGGVRFVQRHRGFVTYWEHGPGD